MCGIFGWMPTASYKDHNLTDTARSQINRLRHRGSNDQGFAIFGSGEILSDDSAPVPRHALGDPLLLLGHTRLSIIDLSSAGKQPMFSKDGRYCIVFNGAIYNYIELRDELREKGVIFASESDTEVLLQALIHWREDALPRLDGMFAFAFYDKETGELFCARDFFGIKPFYWSNAENGFSFASELPALLSFPGANRAVDYAVAYYFLELGIENYGGSCMAAGVELLPPGHCLLINVKKRERPRIWRYWHIPLNEPLQISFAEAAEETRRLFLRSVRLNLRSDVPLGVALSGGMDSSSIAWAVRHLQPASSLHTFSFIAESENISEREWVAIALRQLDADDHSLFINAGDIIADFDQFILSAGEPTASSSYYAQYKLFQLIHEQGTTVSLEGQGADEMLAGYGWYVVHRLQTCLEKKEFDKAGTLISAAAAWPDTAPQVPVLQAMLSARLSQPKTKWERRLFTRWLSLFKLKKPLMRQATSSWLRTENVGMIPVAPPWEDSGYASPDKMRQSLASSLTWYSLNAQLLRGDHFAMAASVESRVPFCNRELAEFLLSLPENYLLDETGRSKAVFREAMRGITPDAIIDRKRKIGFETPGEQDCRALARNFEDIFDDSADDPFVNTAAIRAAWQNMSSGELAFDWSVWRAAVYLRWKRLLRLQ